MFPTTFLAYNGTFLATGGRFLGTSRDYLAWATTPAPTISSFAPTSGPAGTVVAITGTNFTGATAVTFNGVAATAFAVNSATSISATVPAAAASGAVSVTTPTGTATSVATYHVRPAGQALQFTRSSMSGIGSAYVPEVAMTTQLTIEGWFYFDQDEANPFVLDMVTRYYSFILWVQPLLMAPGRAGLLGLFNYNDGSFYWAGDGAGGYKYIPNRTWCHIAVTLDMSLPSDQLKYYFNGQLLSAHMQPAALPAQPNVGIDMGWILTDGDRRYRGLMDEVRVWSVPRTAAQIAANYRYRNLASNDRTGLVAHVGFDETGSVYFDKSPLQNHFTPQAGAQDTTNTHAATGADVE